MSKIFENNKKVMKTTKTSDTNLYNLIYKVMGERSRKSDPERDSGTERQIKQKVDEYYAKYQDKTLDIFFSQFFDRPG